MECLGDDLCTLQDLSDSNLLSCLESRYKRNVQHALLGQAISIYLSPSTDCVQSQADRLARSILHDLCTQGDDQCLLLYGSKSVDKRVIHQTTLASLLSQTTRSSSSGLTAKIMEGAKLLSLLTTCEGCTECVLVTSIYVEPVTMEMTGGQFSCMLLNTEMLGKFQVLADMDMLTEGLEKLGMPLDIRGDYMAVLNAVKSLLAGEDVCGCLGVVDSAELTKLTAQLLYAYLVRWTVTWLNSDLAPPPSDSSRKVLLLDQPDTWMDSCHNSLSELITRYTSETLHNIYCHRVFVWEQEQYVDEGVDWNTVPVDFNQTVMDTFHKADGLLYSVGLDTSDQIATALTSCCETSGDSCYEADSDTFVVTHFTGEQSYVVTDNWPIINSAHFVSHDLVDGLKTSTNQVLKDMSEAMIVSSPDVLLPNHTHSDHSHSLTSRAQLCMSAVCEEITTCNPHFVMYINTNPSATTKDKTFDPTHVLTQLQHLRVLDTALIQSCGYPVRISHERFISTYSSLLIARDTSLSAADSCTALIEAAQLEDCHVGLHQVLLKPWHVGQLEDALTVLQTSARKLQQAFRRSYSRRHSDRLRMEKALSMLNQTTISEDSEDDDNLSPSSLTPVTSTNGTEQEEPSVDDYSESSQSPIPPNRPASQPHPPPPARPHLSPPSQMSPAQASPASPKSPARSGASRAKKRSWGKDVRPPLTRHTPTPSTTPPSQSDHTSNIWYHGKISRASAEKVLRSFQCDCFLIRESQNRPGEFSLSLTHKGGLKHYRIDTKPGAKKRYELFGAKRSFLQLSDLVEYYTQHCISADGELLTAPCPSEDSSEDCPPPLPPPRRTNLSSIKRPQQSIRKLHNRPKPVQRSTTLTTLTKGSTHPPLGQTRPQSMDIFTADISDESISLLQKELDIEERILEAARRLADMPSGNKRERQRRKQSLADVRSRLLVLRQQYHTLQERRTFIELSMQNIVSHTRRVSEPIPPPPPPRKSVK